MAPAAAHRLMNGKQSMTTSETIFNTPDFISQAHWNVERPHVLVVCCSDGRLQTAIDEFTTAFMRPAGRGR